MSEFGLFLIPSTSQYKKYTEVIKDLSKKYSIPEFDAHVTVIGAIEAEEKDVVSRVKKIAEGYKKLEVEFLGINFSDTYYKCVFAQIKMTPHLLNLYKELGTEFQYIGKSAFFPHMSFLYGDFPSEKKSEIADQVKVDKNLLLDKLVIVRNGPLPSDWTHVAEFELN